MNPPASPTQSRLTAVALLLAGSVGVPSLVAVFKPDIVRSPKTAIPLLVLWEILVLMGSTAAKVWEKLESRWVDWLANRAHEWLSIVFSGYRLRYLKWLFNKHRDFDVKGLTTQGTFNLELEQVFVDLIIEPKPAHTTSTNPIRSVLKDLAGRRQIWEYLQATEGHLALIGPPGSGKTTLLKKIALEMTGKRRPKIHQTIPILLFLRDHAEGIQKEAPISLAAAVEEAVPRKQGPVPPARWFQSHLDAGHCLVLLDGLDEVATAEVRKRVGSWIEDQIAAYPKNRFLITARPHGYRNNPISGVTVLEVQPFNRDQVHRFVSRWYLANEIRASGKRDPGVEMAAREGAEDLLMRLGNSQTLTDLAVNPLLLTMIATVHRFRSSLPGRRVELYAEICEVFLGKRQQARGMESDLTPSQKQRVLQPLAYNLMCMKKREVPFHDAVTVIAESLRRVAGEKPSSPESDFLKEIENGSGLLLERESGIYSFAHLAFQEYLTAVHIREAGLAVELVAKVADPWWHEVIRLYGAQGDASPIIAACLASDYPSVPVLTLAVDCVEEAREVDPPLRGRLNELIAESLEDPASSRFRPAVETLFARRIRNMIQVNAVTAFDHGYITNAEYQMFLNDGRSRGEYRYPEHWLSICFPAGTALSPVAGIRSTDAAAFCEWLTDRENGLTFSLPARGELAEYKQQQVQTNRSTVEGHWCLGGFERTHKSTRNNHRRYLLNEISLRGDFGRREMFDHALDDVLANGLDLAGARTRKLEKDIEYALSNFCSLYEQGDSLRETSRYFMPKSDYIISLNLSGLYDKPVTKETFLKRAALPLTELIILKGRITNELPPFEGLRIVKRQ